MTITTEPVEVDDEEPLDYELPDLELLSADSGDPDAAVRFAFLDPACLVPNDINRTFTDDDLADLLASVPVVGFLQAAVVVPIDVASSRYRVLIGNRRRAAAERLNRSLPSLIVRSGDSVQEILAILSENDDRLALKPSQKAALYQQLTLLDWKPAQIAKARGVKTAEVRAALALVDLPEPARQAADDGQLTLDMAADLADFADDPKALAKVIERGNSGPWGFRHAITEARQRRFRQNAADRLFAELTLAGVKIASKPRGFGYGSKEAAATALLDADGNRLDPDAVKTLPGFAAFIDKQAYGGPEATIFAPTRNGTATPAPGAPATCPSRNAPSGMRPPPRRKRCGKPSTSRRRCGASSCDRATATRVRPRPITSRRCATRSPTRRRCRTRPATTNWPTALPEPASATTRRAPAPIASLGCWSRGG
jgi:ParB/RepB/Spo0J family partition protein